MKFINVMNNTPASSFKIEDLSTLVNTLKRTHKTVVEIEDTTKECQTKLDAAKVNIQKALDTNNYDDMQKFVAESKRLEAKLGESPQIKAADFDKALNELARFLGNTAAIVVPVDEAVDEKPAIKKVA